MIHLDDATQGLLVYSAMALLAGRVLGLKPAAVILLASVGWVPFLMVKVPYLGGTAAALLLVVVLHRYGWRHVLGVGFVTVTFCLVLLARVHAYGYQFGAALVVAVHDTTWLVLKAAACLWAYQLARGKLGYLAGYGWQAERRALQHTAEYRTAMGAGRRRLGRLGKRASDALVGQVDARGLPAPMFHDRESWWRPW